MDEFLESSRVWWVHVGLVVCWVVVLRSFLRVVGVGYWYALVSLVGTMLHELCHWVVGFVLCGKPVGVSLWPRRSGDGRGWTLGSVSFRGLTIWNAGAVAFAPLLLWALGAWVVIGPMVWAYGGERYGEWMVMGYVVGCCVIGGLPSKVDVRLGWKSLVMYGVLWGCWRWWSGRLG